MIQINPSKFDGMIFSGIYLCRLRLKQGYASFKQVKPWPWHVEFIPGVSVVGLVTNEELCRVVWGIIIKNFMHKYSFIVSELLR